MELPGKRIFTCQKKNRIALNVFACKPPDMKMLGTASMVAIRKNDMGWNGT